MDWTLLEYLEMLAMELRDAHRSRGTKSRLLVSKPIDVEEEF